MDVSRLLIERDQLNAYTNRNGYRASNNSFVLLPPTLSQALSQARRWSFCISSLRGLEPI